MKSLDVEALLKEIITQSETLAQELLKDFSQKGVAAVKEFLADSKGDLVRWTGELAEGQIDQSDLDDLIKGQVSAALMIGLQETGLAQVELDRFTSGVTSIIVSVAFDAAKGLV